MALIDRILNRSRQRPRGRCPRTGDACLHTRTPTGCLPAVWTEHRQRIRRVTSPEPDRRRHVARG